MYKVLAIDGGGIRGIIPAKWLDNLEQRLGTGLADHFDLIAGTSTGSILAAGVAAGIPASRLLSLYNKEGRTIFPPRGFSRNVNIWDWISRPKYPDAPLAEVLENYFSFPGGKAIRLRDLKADCVIVSYDVLKRSPVIFKSWLPEHGDIPVWEVCKASSSAPTYFPAHVLNINGVDCPLIDGGVVANNPSSLALAVAIGKQFKDDLASFEASQELFVVSMGTGNLTKPITIDQAKEWGQAQWAFPILDVVFDGASSADEIVCQAILKDDQYVRLQVELTVASDDLDDASPKNCNKLMAQAEAYLSDNDGRRNLDRILRALQADPE